MPVTGSVTDLDVLIQGYSSYLSALKKSPRTVDEYTKDVQRWARWFKRPVEYFHQDEWDDYTAFLDQSGVSGASVRRYQSALRKFFKYLRRRKVCKNEPDKDSETVAKRKSLPSFLLEHEVALVLSKVSDPRSRGMLELCYSCGLRNEEVRGLKLSQVQPAHLQLYGKGNKERVVPLMPKSRAVLDAWLEERPEGDLVFPADHGGIMDDTVIRRALTKATQAAGVKDCGVHGLRHSIATHLAMRKVPVEEIQVFMGHERIDTTMRYVHLAKQISQQAVLMHHPMA